MTVTTTLINGLDCVILENETLAATLCPAAGGKISSLVLKNPDVELLWNNPRLVLRAYPAGTEYDPHFFGGIDELLPNDEKERINDRDYPDHGELWTSSLEWERTEEGIRLRADLPIAGLRYEKKLALGGAGQIRMTYRIVNLRQTENHFLLKMHAALRLHKGDRLICDAKRGEIADADFTGRHSARFFDWPHYGDERLDIAGGPEEARNEFFFLHDLGKGEMRMESPEAGTFFSYAFDTAVFPLSLIHIWPGPGRGKVPAQSPAPAGRDTKNRRTCLLYTSIRGGNAKAALQKHHGVIPAHAAGLGNVQHFGVLQPLCLGGGFQSL